LTGAAVLNSILTSKWTKVVVFTGCLVPAAWLVWRGFNNDLTADPIAFITHTTGDWTLRFLIITLAITPLRKVLHLPQLIRFRRMLGLFAFFYVCLHFTTWIWLDHSFAWPDLWKDVLKRPFITVGFTGFVLLIPLAITSTAGWIRRLGGKRWQMLHRLIYVIAVLGVIHYYWLVKSDVRKPLFYGALVAILLAWRLATWLINRRGRPTGASVRREAAVTAETA
jgi:methionine sulfoxide reductase heme-binding subunit